MPSYFFLTADVDGLRNVRFILTFYSKNCPLVHSGTCYWHVRKKILFIKKKNYEFILILKL